MLVHLIELYYRDNAAGGNLHIVLDDGNYGKGFVQCCIKDAIENKDFIGETIGNMLLEFSEDEQEQIIERKWEIWEEWDENS